MSNCISSTRYEYYKMDIRLEPAKVAVLVSLCLPLLFGLRSGGRHVVAGI
jgi:hypothetical protein